MKTAQPLYQERDELLQDCTQLLNEISKQRYATSLLTKTKSFMEGALEYKSNRNTKSS